jgi:methylated-DNA-[protein]-cysteine S-methyltransferase
MYTRHAVVDTALGEVTLVASGGSIVGLHFQHRWHRPAEDTFGTRVPVATDGLLRDAAGQLHAYLDGDRASFDLSIATSGDAFQERVWELLREIPRGETVTYGALAKKLGDKSLAQLVGQAVGRNPLCVVVPCHRVVGADGRLTGYAGGLARKKFLLDLEEPALATADRLF